MPRHYRITLNLTSTPAVLNLMSLLYEKYVVMTKESLLQCKCIHKRGRRKKW